MNPKPPDKSQPQKSLTERTVSGFAWMFSGSIAGAGLQLVVTMILARLLSPADFGLLSAALVVIYFSEIFSQLGIGPALVQRKELGANHISTGFTVNLFFTLLLVGLILITSPVIASFYRLPGLSPILQALAIIFPIRGMAMVSESLLKRAGHFRQLATLNLISYLFGYALVGVVTAWMGYGVWALVAATIGQAVLSSILLFWRVPYSVRPGFERSAFRDLMGFGSGLTIASLANYFARQGDNFIVGRWLGAEALGFYGKAFSLMTLPTKQFSKVMDEVLFPVFSEVQDEEHRLTLGFHRSVRIIALLVLPASCLAVVLAPEIIRIFYGPNWESTIVPFQILCMSMFFRSAYKISGSICRALGTVYDLAKIQFVYAFLVVGGALIGQKWGIVGVALSSSIAIAVNYILMSRNSINALNSSWKIFIRFHIPGILLASSTLFVAYLTASVFRILGISSLVLVAFATLTVLITYLLLIFLFPTIFGKDGKWMFSQLRKLLTNHWIRMRSVEA